MAENNNNDEERYVHLEEGVPIFSPALEDPDPKKRREQETENTYRNKQTALQSGILYTQIGLVVFGLFGIGLNLWQTSTARYSAEISEKSILLGQKTERDSRLLGEKQLMEGQKSFQATIDNFHLDQRAWINISAVEPFQLVPTESFGLRFAITNSGRTPAFHVKNRVVLHSLPINEPFRAIYGNLPPGEPDSDSVMLPNGGSTIETARFPLTQAQIDAIHTNVIRAYVYGFIDYQDVFGKNHTTRFCKIIRDTNKAQDCPTYSFAD